MNLHNQEYQRLIQPTLSLLKHASDFVELEEISDTLTEILHIPVLELEKMLPSGRQTIFENQLGWALSYLEQDDLIESDGSTAYRLRRIKNSSRQTKIIATGTINPMRNVTKAINQKSAGPNVTTSKPGEDIITEEFNKQRRSLSRKLIKRIHQQSPQFFENLIIDLLLAMEYGNRRRDISQHLGKSSDGGVDGAIHQDQLGLETVYVQAKRYKPQLAVPVSAVRDFAGALSAHKASKGVFVTTSHFTKASRRFVADISSRIVLINGQRLADLLVRNNIGVKIDKTLELKRLNEDYFV